jgi:hypothetical protein
MSKETISTMSPKTALQNYFNIDISSMRPAGFLDKEAFQIETTASNVNQRPGDGQRDSRGQITA